MIDVLTLRCGDIISGTKALRSGGEILPYPHVEVFQGERIVRLCPSSVHLKGERNLIVAVATEDLTVTDRRADDDVTYYEIEKISFIEPSDMPIPAALRTAEREGHSTLYRWCGDAREVCARLDVPAINFFSDMFLSSSLRTVTTILAEGGIVTDSTILDFEPAAGHQGMYRGIPKPDDIEILKVVGAAFAYIDPETKMVVTNEAQRW